MILDHIQENRNKGKKTFAVLIDPDKQSESSLIDLVKKLNQKPGPDLILVGGSIVLNGIDQTVALIKKNTSLPVILFPGNALQFSPKADGILFLSLISGRNPDFLIGNHVLSATRIKKSGIEVIPTGYILINSGADTSVSYMSNTVPIPYQKPEIAIATAIAGELLGLKLIYLEAGSGAPRPVSDKMIQAVKKNSSVPLIVGGGIKTPKQLENVLKAGADMVVVGTAIEKDSSILTDFASIVSEF
ncbi:MAG: geranylgeranylglyceryl/heptaprenylglyceryl phosphate synthase [Salinivirgaceae bacterium]|nr:geranylgeranylglyceryl/heptaprenylglyceryl phosphate synthase [Salinivirgaceae bacterium]